MINTTQSRIDSLSVHTIGNKTKDEDILLSDDLLDISDEKVQDLLHTFFLTPFVTPEFYAFTLSNGEHALNPVYNFAMRIFEAPETLHENSVDIARHLYELSMHPQIKSGDLFVVLFQDLILEDQLTEAIGIFKSENRQAFLQVDNSEKTFTIRTDSGINVEKLDKGCLIFNTDKASGYRVCIVDKSNTSIEAQYWRDQFLRIKPCSDDYHHTKAYMQMTKNFVAKQLPEEYDVTKADQIDLLNRSAEFFKSNEKFQSRHFEDEVLKDEGVITSFRNFNENYRKSQDTELVEDFDISPLAVKKQARVFKSVLKLDKNFHVYIHGDRNLIEQGVESDGRKFYKIYYDNEA